MNLESPKVVIEKSSQIVFDFLKDVKNFESLMPVNISKFELINDEIFLFALSGMPEITLKKKYLDSPNIIVLGAEGGKLDFSLTAYIKDISKNKSEVYLNFKGDFNPMMTMMIKGPISKFIETLALNVSKNCN
ncbi:MAG: SRPBCC family protein [Flavobacteriaceae bacterium]|nr:SRPBCC family protein [Flavobacteriaceae bacterium]|tara:strand:+ start:489 stop:887 length:399 start_codon:yes stop_codon:yes gene_type:complete